MDNENKEIDMTTQKVEPETVDFEFDPTASEEFYNNLEAAIGIGEDADVAGFPELLTEEDPFGADSVQLGEGYTEQEEELFAGVDAALTEQIEQEFGKEEASSSEEQKTNKFMTVWKAIPTWTKVLVSIILVVLISVGLLFGTEGGRNLVYNVIVGIVFKDIPVDPVDPDYITPEPDGTLTVTPAPTAEPNVTPNPDETLIPTEIPTPTTIPTVKLMDDENVINVLLLGEENMKGAVRGRTDAIILVSVNLDGGPLKMVSFQRDLFVAIPGKADDRLNAAYAYGGAKLIVETIEKNFGVDIDSYVKVGFDGFENIIDQLGGLRISLTAKESDYLNRTDYISKPEDRNTVAGYQTMTGSQVLGYCRVRYVATAEGLKNDIGRNYRHRVVLKAIFEQCKNKSLGELLSIMGQCFDYVSVDANLQPLAVDCLSAVIEKKMFEIDTLQMPLNGENKNITVDDGKEVVNFWPEDVAALQNFLYGE